MSQVLAEAGELPVAVAVTADGNQNEEEIPVNDKKEGEINLNDLNNILTSDEGKDLTQKMLMLLTAHMCVTVLCVMVLVAACVALAFTFPVILVCVPALCCLCCCISICCGTGTAIVEVTTNETTPLVSTENV